MRNNKKDYKTLERALKHLDKLENVDLDDLLRLSTGANCEVISLRMRVTKRMQWLKENDPDCILKV